MQMQALPSTSVAPQAFHAIDISNAQADVSSQASGHPASINQLFGRATEALAANVSSMTAPKAEYANRDSADSHVRASTQAVHEKTGKSSAKNQTSKNQATDSQTAAVTNQEKCGCLSDTIGCIGEAVTSFMISFCAVTCALNSHFEA